MNRRGGKSHRAGQRRIEGHKLQFLPGDNDHRQHNREDWQQLERGRLSLKTDDLGTVDIEWDKVTSVTAAAPFDVEDLAGHRYLGSLQPESPGQLRIEWKGTRETVALQSVVRIRRLDTSFWGRLDGSLDLGASYTSATSRYSWRSATSGSILAARRPGTNAAATPTIAVTAAIAVSDTGSMLG